MKTIDQRQRHWVRPGMLVKAIGFHGNTERVVEGGVYTVVRVEEGIFPDRPYVTVKDADGREHSGFHLTRFALLDAIGNGEE